MAAAVVSHGSNPTESCLLPNQDLKIITKIFPFGPNRGVFDLTMEYLEQAKLYFNASQLDK